jgi:hypothetical protein
MKGGKRERTEEGETAGHDNTRPLAGDARSVQSPRLVRTSLSICMKM